MTKREYYDRLVANSLAGRYPATNNDGEQCRYLTADGRKCFVGEIIPPSEYTSRFEGLLVGANVIEGEYRDEDIKHLKSVVDINLPEGMTTFDMERLQAIHDEIAFDGKWDHQRLLGLLHSLDCFREFA